MAWSDYRADVNRLYGAFKGRDNGSFNKFGSRLVAETVGIPYYLWDRYNGHKEDTRYASNVWRSHSVPIKERESRVGEKASLEKKSETVMSRRRGRSASVTGKPFVTNNAIVRNNRPRGMSRTRSVGRSRSRSVRGRRRAGFRMARGRSRPRRPRRKFRRARRRSQSRRRARPGGPAGTVVTKRFKVGTFVANWTNAANFNTGTNWQTYNGLLFSTPQIDLTGPPPDNKMTENLDCVDNVMPFNVYLPFYWNSIASTEALVWREFEFLDIVFSLVTKCATTVTAQIIMAYSFDPTMADAGTATPGTTWTDTYVENMNQVVSLSSWHNATMRLRLAKQRRWYELRGYNTTPAVSPVTRSWQPSDMRQTVQGMMFFKVIAATELGPIQLADLYMDFKIRYRGAATVVGSNLNGTGGPYAPGFYPFNEFPPPSIDVVDPETKIVRRIVKERYAPHIPPVCSGRAIGVGALQSKEAMLASKQALLLEDLDKASDLAEMKRKIKEFRESKGYSFGIAHTSRGDVGYVLGKEEKVRVLSGDKEVDREKINKWAIEDYQKQQIKEGKEKGKAGIVQEKKDRKNLVAEKSKKITKLSMARLVFLGMIEDKKKIKIDGKECDYDSKEVKAKLAQVDKTIEKEKDELMELMKKASRAIDYGTRVSRGFDASLVDLDCEVDLEEEDDESDREYVSA